MLTDKTKIWLTWEDQRRSIVLSKQFGAKLFVLQFNSSNRMLRYLVLMVRTFKVIISERAQYVFCQNPSMMLALFLCIVKKIFGYKLIVDRHSNFIIDTNSKLLIKIHDIISDYTIRIADFTVVTNEYLNKLVSSKLGRGLVLQDKLPTLNLAEKVPLEGKINITFVTSFNFDEPISEVISSFENIDPHIHLYITGNYRKHSLTSECLANKTSNIHFTGFLSEKDYQDLLYSSDALIVLTKFEYILTCGAYEGIALGKPLILSNTKTIKEYFNKGAVYCDPLPESINTAINNCISNINLLKEQIDEFKMENEIVWNNKFSKITSIIYH